MKKMLGFAFAILLMLVLVWDNTYTISSYMEEQGFVMPAKNIEETLSTRKVIKNEEKRIDLLEVNFKDTVYEKHGSYYVNDNKDKIDLNYPMVIRKERALKFKESGSYLINEDFDSVVALENMVVSGQNSFNSDGSQADVDTFILAQTQKGMYIALTPTKVKTLLESYELPKHSIMYFDEEYMNVFSYHHKGYDYEAIRGMQNATVEIDGKEYKYEELLKKLNVVKEESEKQTQEEEQKEKEIKEKYKKEQSSEKKDALKKEGEENKGNESNGETNKPLNPEEGEKPEKPSKPENPDNPDNPENPDEPENPDNPDEPENPGEPDDPSEPEQPKYHKPEVSVGEIKPWVYAISTKLDIKDPSTRIIRGVRFDVRDPNTGRVILRKQYRESGEVNLTVVPPESDLIVSGTYQYYREDNTKDNETFLEDKIIKTLAIKDNIKSIRVNYELEKYSHSQKFIMHGLELENTSDYNPDDKSLDNFYKNTLPYVAKGIITFVDEDDNKIEATISGDNINKLVKGEKLEYQTSTILSSATKYQYTLEFEDKYGNKIPLEKELKGMYQTAKMVPNVITKIETNKPSDFSFTASLNDRDNAILDENYKLLIVDQNNNPLPLKYEINGVKGEGNEITVPVIKIDTDIKITNLPFSQLMYLKAYASYDIQNGEGQKTNQEINSLRFYSAAIADGNMNYTNSFTNINGTYITMNLELNQKTTSSLVELMTDFKISFQAVDGELIEYKLNRGALNKVDIEKNYDEQRKSLIVQKEDKNNKIPEITLEAPKELFIDNSVWDAFLYGAYNGTGNGQGAKMHVTLTENTLQPSTKYKVNINSYADQGGSVFDLNTIIAKDNFTTKKREPQVRYDDAFLAQDFLEMYKVYVDDVDETIINGNFVIQTVEEGNVISTQEFHTNTQIEQVRLTNMKEGNKYIIRFMAPLYNDGQSISTQVKNYIFKEYNFIGGEGVQAEISLNDMQYAYENNGMEENNLINRDKILLNTGYNETAKTEEAKEGTFLTDYIPLRDASIFRHLIIKDLGSSGTIIRVHLFNESKGYATTLRGVMRPDLDMVNQDRNLAGAFGNSVYQYMRIEGFMGYENLAIVKRYENDDFTKKYDINDNKYQYKENYYINGATGREESSLNYNCTDFIAVEPGEVYWFNRVNTDYSISYYGSDKHFLGFATSNELLKEIPSNVKYIKMQFTNKNWSNAIFKMNKYEKSTPMDSFTGEILWSLSDKNGFIKDKDQYTITRYKTKDFKRYKYQLDNSFDRILHVKEGEILNIQDKKQENYEKNCAYKYEISISYHGKKVVLDTLEFNTKSKVFVIRNELDLANVGLQPTGQFIVVEDIYETQFSLKQIGFSGTLDFQGHTWNINLNAGMQTRIICLNKGGTIKNANISISKAVTEYNCYFMATNRGNVENVMFSIDNNEDTLFTYTFIDVNDKAGVISNFIVEVNGALMAKKAPFVTSNAGIIRNGYLYNKVKNAHVYVQGHVGIITNTNTESGTIENIYAVSDIYCDYEKGVQNGQNYSSGVISSINKGIIKNVFGVSNRYGYYLEDGKPVDTGPEFISDPLFGQNSPAFNDNSNSYQNIYLNSTYSQYKSKYAKSFDSRSLWDSQWYSKNIGKSDAFNIERMVLQGYYPQLKMNETMTKHQAYISLPETYEGIQPELISSHVIEQKEDPEKKQDYALVELKFKNPNKTRITRIVSDQINCQIQYQEDEGDFYNVIIKMSNPKMFVSSYQIQQFSYLQKPLELTKSVEHDVEVEFYDSITSFLDWSRMKASPNQNYRLKTDLDFSGVSKWVDVNINNLFTGKLDGGIYDEEGHLVGRHILKNLNLDNYSGNNIVSYNLFNSIKKAKIMNLDIKSFIGHNDGSIGLIGISSNSIFDNVHMVDVDIQGSLYVSAFTNSSSRNIYENCSATNVKITSKANPSYNQYYGGLTSVSSTDIFKNCFVSGLNMITKDMPIANGSGFGGIVGVNTFSSFDSCYVTGKIVNFGNNGGIVGMGTGTTNIRRCYSNVMIEAEGDNNGGIASAALIGDYSSNLSVGSFILASNNLSNTHRISAKEAPLNFQNYAYEAQKKNGQSFDIDDTDGLLTQNELKDPDTYEFMIGMGEQYDYSKVHEARLPYLKSTKGEMLPYQGDNYYPSNAVSVEVSDTQVNGQNYVTQILVHHEGFKVSNILIEGMDIQSTQKIESGEEVTAYKITSTKQMAVDLYKLRVELVGIDDVNRKEELTAVVDFKVPIYWEISNATQWQAIMANHKDTNENFKITGNVDFSTVENPILDIKANRVEGIDTETSVIQNLDGKRKNNVTGEMYPYQDLMYKNVISVVMNNLSNIKFKNINYLYQKNYQNLGIVGINKGKASDLVFENNKIDFQATRNTVQCAGMIARNEKEVHNIRAKNISIKANNTGNSFNDGIGGIFGNLSSISSNLSGENIVIDSPELTNRIGGLVGLLLVDSLSTDNPTNWSGENITVSGAGETGGLVGWASGSSKSIYNVTIKNADISGSNKDYVGGIIGYGNIYINNTQLKDEITVADCTIQGSNYVGGVAGAAPIINCKVKNSKIIAENLAGGIASGQLGTVTDSQVIGSEIKAKNVAGGVSAMCTAINSYVFDSTIAAERFAGGIVGVAGSYSIYTGAITASSTYVSASGILDSKVIATKDYAGGLVATINSSAGTSINHSFSKNTDVSSDGYTGGLAGEVTYSKGFNNSYVEGGTINGTGIYTGGLYGKITLKEPTTTINSLYSNANLVNGQSYTGGLFGQLVIDNAVTNLNISGVFNNSSVESPQLENGAHAIGWIENDRVIPEKRKLFTLDTVKVNNQFVSEDSLTSVHTSLISKEKFMNNDFYTGAADNGNLGYELDYQLKGLNARFELQNFDLVVTDLSDMSFELYNVNLADGVYKLVVMNTGNGLNVYVNDIHVKDHKAKVKLDLKGAYSFDFKIYDSNQTTMYASSIFQNINSINMNTMSMNVEKEDGSVVSDGYYFSDTNEMITFRLPEGNYRWYRSLNTKGYQNSVVDITNYANGNELTVNLPGQYWATKADNTLLRTKNFIYNTKGFLPKLSSLENKQRPFQDGYSIGDGGAINTNIYPLVFKEGTTIGHASRAAMPNVRDKLQTPSKIKETIETIEFPTWEVYASGVDSINVEFDTNLKSLLAQYPLKIRITSDDQSKEYNVDSRVMSFGYHFKSDLKVELFYEDQIQEQSYAPTEIQSTISTNQNNYYYKTLDGVSSDTKILSGDFVHLFKNKAMNRKGEVYNLDTSKKVDVLNANEKIESRSLYDSEYEGNKLQTFYRYSECGEIEREMSVIGAHQKLYVVSGELKRNSPWMIADYYQDKQYLFVLNDKGQMISLMDEMEEIKDFSNKGIAEITYDIYSEEHKALLRYENGDVAILDFVRGDIKAIGSLKQEQGFMSFVANSLSDFFGQFSNEEVNYAYKDAKAMEAEISSLSNEQLQEIEAIVDANTSKKGNVNFPIDKENKDYISVYNPITNTYDTYLEQELIHQETTLLNSVNDKLEIAKEHGYSLKKSLLQNKKASKESSEGNTAMIFTSAIVATIFALLWVLKRKYQIQKK